MKIYAGRTFFLGARADRRKTTHLWVAVTDCHGDPPFLFAVMLSTLRAQAERTVILAVGDHPFIRHATSVAYNTVRRINCETLAQNVTMGGARFHDDLDDPVLAQVQAGLLTSENVEAWIAGQFRDWYT